MNKKLFNTLIIFLLMLIVILSLTNCATEPIIVPPPVLLKCPDIESSTPQNVLYKIKDTQYQYDICKHQTDLYIKWRNNLK